MEGICENCGRQNCEPDEDNYDVTLIFPSVLGSDFLHCQECIDKKMSSEEIIICEGLECGYYTFEFYTTKNGTVLCENCYELDGVPDWAEDEETYNDFMDSYDPDVD